MGMQTVIRFIYGTRERKDSDQNTRQINFFFTTWEDVSQLVKTLHKPFWDGTNCSVYTRTFERDTDRGDIFVYSVTRNLSRSVIFIISRKLPTQLIASNKNNQKLTYLKERREKINF